MTCLISALLVWVRSDLGVLSLADETVRPITDGLQALIPVEGHTPRHLSVRIARHLSVRIESLGVIRVLSKCSSLAQAQVAIRPLTSHR